MAFFALNTTKFGTLGLNDKYVKDFCWKCQFEKKLLKMA